MHMTINVKTGRIYLPREAVEFLRTDRIEITSEDNQFTINERTGAYKDDGIKISKDNAIYDSRVAKWIAGQYDINEDTIRFEIGAMVIEDGIPVVYVKTGLPCTNRDD